MTLKQNGVALGLTVVTLMLTFIAMALFKEAVYTLLFFAGILTTISIVLAIRFTGQYLQQKDWL